MIVRRTRRRVMRDAITIATGVFLLVSQPVLQWFEREPSEVIVLAGLALLGAVPLLHHGDKEMDRREGKP